MKVVPQPALVMKACGCWINHRSGHGRVCAAHNVGGAGTLRLQVVGTAPLITAPWGPSMGGERAFYCLTHADPRDCPAEAPRIAKQGQARGWCGTGRLVRGGDAATKA